MKFAIASVSYWDSIGLDSTKWRKSLDGTQALCHVEYVERLGLNISANSNVKIYNSVDANFVSLLSSPEWTTDKLTGDPDSFSILTELSEFETRINDAVALQLSGIESGVDPTEIATLQAEVDKKATIEALNSLSTTVDGKADKSALTTLETEISKKATVADITTAVEVKADKDDLTSLTTTVDGKAAKGSGDNVNLTLLGDWTGSARYRKNENLLVTVEISISKATEPTALEEVLAIPTSAASTHRGVINLVSGEGEVVTLFMDETGSVKTTTTHGFVADTVYQGVFTYTQ